MLFHVTATHTPENCPLYNTELQHTVRDALPKIEELAQQLGLTVHFNLSGAPDHVNYWLVETDDFSSVQKYLAAQPMRLEFRITPVTSLQQVADTLLEDGQ